MLARLKCNHDARALDLLWNERHASSSKPYKAHNLWCTLSKHFTPRIIRDFKKFCAQIYSVALLQARGARIAAIIAAILIYCTTSAPNKVHVCGYVVEVPIIGLKALAGSRIDQEKGKAAEPKEK